jgi:hypothetical protein
MYLHIGNGESIKEKEILGIFDLDTATVSKNTKKFISNLQKKNLVDYTDFDLPRSFVVFGKRGNIKVKLSRISSLGLGQRINNEIKTPEE